MKRGVAYVFECVCLGMAQAYIAHVLTPLFGSRVF